MAEEKKPTAKKTVTKKPVKKAIPQKKPSPFKIIWRKLDVIGISGKVILILVVIGVLARLFEKL